jgi:hypothetical protein
VLSLFSPVSCKKEKVTACDVESPWENLPWLKSLLESSFCKDIYKYTNDTVEYIVVADCDLASDRTELVFKCDGSLVCTHGGISPGSGGCNLPSIFWESYNQEKILIYVLRDFPK